MTGGNGYPLANAPEGPGASATAGGLASQPQAGFGGLAYPSAEATVSTVGSEYSEVTLLPITWTSTTITRTTTTSSLLFFCFSVMMADSYEEGLITKFLQSGVGIFACDLQAVLSSTSKLLGSYNG